MALPRVLLATFVAVLLTHSHTAAAAEATLMLLRDAVNEGAVCLDGSPPGYYFRPGPHELLCMKFGATSASALVSMQCRIR